MSTIEKLGDIPTAQPSIEVFPVLDRNWPRDGLGSVATIVAQLPDPGDLEPGALIMVRQSGARPKGVRGALFALRGLFSKPPQAHCAVRCTALLARGYREISAAPHRRTGEELVWGIARP